MHTRATFPISSMLRHQALSSEAVYRVLRDDGELVSVEVLAAPGLEHGTRLTITAQSARAMAAVSERPAPRPDTRGRLRLGAGRLRPAR